MDEKVIKWIADRRKTIKDAIGSSKQAEVCLDEVVGMLLCMGAQLPKHIDSLVDVSNTLDKIKLYGNKDKETNESESSAKEKGARPYGYGYE